VALFESPVFCLRAEPAKPNETPIFRRFSQSPTRDMRAGSYRRKLGTQASEVDR
jgi:hypothetical protein